MGRYVTSVATTTVRLIEDTPDVINQSIMGSIQNGTNIANDLLMTITGAYSRNVDRARRYAKEYYTNGLPEGSIGRYSLDEDAVKEVIVNLHPELINGEKIVIVSTGVDTLRVAPLTLEWYLSRNPNFNYETDDIYLYNLNIGTPKDPIYTDFSGKPYRLERINSPTSMLTVLKGQYLNTVTGGDYDYPYYSVAPVNPSYVQFYNSPDELYIYVSYFITDADDKRIGNNKLWSYRVNSNVFPQITPTKDVLEENFYMPVVPLRTNNRMLNADKSTELYKTSKVLLGMLEIDIEDLSKGIEDNPDIAQIDHAYAVLGANVFSKEQPVLRYLYEFFAQMHAVNGGDAGSVNIKDDTYNVVLKWSDTKFSTESGVKTDKGKYHSEVNLGDTDTIKFIYQVSDDAFLAFTISDLALDNYIYGSGRAATTALDAYNVKDVPEALMIPLNISIITRELTPLEANTLYYESLKLVVNSFDRRKLKWYERGIFKVFTMVVAVAISAITMGAGAAVIALVGGIVVNVAVELVFDIAVAIFGEEVGNIVGAVALVAATIVGSVMGVIPDITQVASIAISAIGTTAQQFIEAELGELQEAIENFETTAEAKTNELKELQNSMDNLVNIDPLAIYSPVNMIPGEPISSYVSSKIELPLQMGTSCYGQLSGWVDSQLQLPSLSYS